MDRDPKKITLREWSEQFKKVNDQVIGRYCYFNNPDWGLYLQPPATFMVYGARELKRLKFDNSFAALRMWGFVFNESERLFRAKQIGKKIIATCGDLGSIPIIILAFPDCIPFYPECIWWTPFFNESTVLLDQAHVLGVPEAACFSKAALSAFYKKAYFPKPDLIFASTGSSCDDYSCVMQLVEDLGHSVTWLEIPYRRDFDSSNRFVGYLKMEYENVYKRMLDLTGIDDRDRLTDSIRKANRLRDFVDRIKHLTYQAEVAPIPALELMTIEFGNLYGYADFDEWIDIVEMMNEAVKERVKKGVGVLKSDAVPIAWVTPSADPYLLNLVEDIGLRVVETEYVINQALVSIEVDSDPFSALARSFLKASLIGSTRERVKRIIKGIKEGRIKGILITNMLGASHCAMETRLIEHLLKDVPVLSIDVPAPFGVTEQIKTRLLAFAEMIRGN